MIDSRSLWTLSDNLKDESRKLREEKKINLIFLILKIRKKKQKHDQSTSHEAHMKASIYELKWRCLMQYQE